MGCVRFGQVDSNHVRKDTRRLALRWDPVGLSGDVANERDLPADERRFVIRLAALSRRELTHLRDKLTEVRSRVPRPRSRFGVVLNTARASGGYRDTLDRAIV